MAEASEGHRRRTKVLLSSHLASFLFFLWPNKLKKSKL
jgi:hypothetical protein